MINFEDTIERLAHDVTPAPTTLSPVRAVGLWLAVSIGASILMMLPMHLRDDLAAQWHHTLFLLRVTVLLGLIGSICVCAVWLSYPDIRQQRWILMTPLPFLALYIALLLYPTALPAPSVQRVPEVNHGIECSLCITMFSLIPGLALFLILRRYATAHPRLTGTLALLASASFGHLALQFAEANDSLLHLCLWHVLPILIIGYIGGWLGQKFLSW